MVIGSFFPTYSLMHHVSCRVFLAKHQITQVTQPHYNPDLAPCDSWLFPKLKSPLKGKKFQIIIEIQENTMEQLMVIGKIVWGPKVPYLKGLRHHCPRYKVSFILRLLQKNSLFFILMAGYILDRHCKVNIFEIESKSETLWLFPYNILKYNTFLRKCHNLCKWKKNINNILRTPMTTLLKHLDYTFNILC